MKINKVIFFIISIFFVYELNIEASSKKPASQNKSKLSAQQKAKIATAKAKAAAAAKAKLAVARAKAKAAAAAKAKLIAAKAKAAAAAKAKAKMKGQPRKFGSVKEIQNANEFNSYLKQGNIVIADFHGERFCPPCRTVAKPFMELARKYPNINFVKVNAETRQDLIKAQRIDILPTFIVYKNGAPVVRGSNLGQIESSIVKRFAKG